jgi:NAD(P)-dependent dehydrogenase (short-subunit alcohol dehydrogenase family)
MLTLDGRGAIVTGGGRGIGAAVARGVADAGAAVVVSDLGVDVDGSGQDAGPAREVADAICAAGGRAKADATDVTDFDACFRLVESTVADFGSLDILVNVAGILRDGMIFKMTEADFDAVINVHLKGTFNTTRHASAWWREHRGGHYRLINFTSASGLFGAPSQPNYAAAKMGIVGLTFSCANALKGYGVTANAILPGWIETGMTEGAIADPKFQGAVLPRIPLRRWGERQDFAGLAVYLASEASRYHTGDSLVVDGAYTIF